MAERITAPSGTERKIDPKTGHAINFALIEGDTRVLFFLIADYLVANRLTMPAESVAMFAERALFEPTS